MGLSVEDTDADPGLKDGVEEGCDNSDNGAVEVGRDRSGRRERSL